MIVDYSGFFDTDYEYKICGGKELAPSIGLGTCMDTRMEYKENEYGGGYGKLIFQDSKNAASRIILNLDYGTITLEDPTVQGGQYQIDSSKGQYTDQVEGKKLTIRTQEGNLAFVITKTGGSKAGEDDTGIY